MKQPVIHVGRHKVPVPLRSYPLLARYHWRWDEGRIMTDLQDCYGTQVEIRFLAMFPNMSTGSHGVN
jgi:hypothetical protein